MGRYNQLVDAVYKRRGWTPNGVPKAKYDTTQVPDGAEVKAVHQIAGG